MANAPPPAICAPLTPAQREAGEIPAARIPRLPDRAADLAGFTPRGWKVVARLAPDLDGDGRADLAAVLMGDDPRCRIPADNGSGGRFDANPKILLVALRRGGGLARQAANARVIPRRSDPYMDDPLEGGGLTAANRALRLTLGSWRSAGGWATFTATYVFRWNGRTFALVGYDRDHLQRNSGQTEKTSVNFLTRRAKVVTGWMEDDEPERTRWKPLPAQVVPTLESMGDGLDYRPGL